MLTANRVASRSAVITVGGDCIAAELVDSNESCIANAPLRLVGKAACTDADEIKLIPNSLTGTRSTAIHFIGLN